MAVPIAVEAHPIFVLATAVSVTVEAVLDACGREAAVKRAVAPRNESQAVGKPRLEGMPCHKTRAQAINRFRVVNRAQQRVQQHEMNGMTLCTAYPQSPHVLIKMDEFSVHK